MKTSRVLTAACAVLLVAIPSLAHHSFAAEYNANKALTLRGKVTKVDWVNPHSWLHIDVTGEDGKVTSWACETAPPNILYRQGWRRDSLKVGEDVVIEGFAAKDASHTMTARTVQTPDGKKLLAGSPTDGGPQPSK
jgi:hypothetical protein